MARILTKQDDPRIGGLLNSIMDQGADEFEMVDFRGIRVIKDPEQDFKVLIEVDVNYDHLGSGVDDTLQVGWNGTYEELFESSERKSKLLTILYDSTSDLLGQEEDLEEYF